MTENAFVESAIIESGEEKCRQRVRERFDYWAKSMRFSAWYAKHKYDRNPIRRLFKLTGWHWSHVLTREQRFRFMMSGDPMRDYPDELFDFVREIFVWPPYSSSEFRVLREDIGFPRFTHWDGVQRREFDRLHREYVAAADEEQGQ